MNRLYPALDYNPKGEDARLAFIEKRDGKDAAKDFARRTLSQYRECLRLDGKQGRKFHHATLEKYRRGFVESCLAFRRYLRRHHGLS